MTGNDREDILDLMEANERMGAALSFLYEIYPESREEVEDYLFDYPFEWARSDSSPSHYINFNDEGWTIQHPIMERLEGSLFDCPMTWEGGDIRLRGVYVLLNNYTVDGI